MVDYEIEQLTKNYMLCSKKKNVIGEKRIEAITNLPPQLIS